MDLFFPQRLDISPANLLSKSSFSHLFEMFSLLYTKFSYTWVCFWTYYILFCWFSSVQSISRVWLFVTSWTAACFSVHHQLLELTQTHVHRIGDAIQQSHPLSSLLLLPSVFPSIRVFSNESVLRIRWPKYWNFSFRISPSNEYSGLISFRIVTV